LKCEAVHSSGDFQAALGIVTVFFIPARAGLQKLPGGIQ
jgi:hypothetical protein